jgi:hypothetical protein
MSDAAMHEHRHESPLQAALSYASSGWPVFPCHTVMPNSAGCTCGVEHCSSPGKHPTIRGGLRSASAQLDDVRRWWSRWPKANVAIRTGRESGLVVLDVDPAHGGLDSLRRLIKEHGQLPVTLAVSTGSNGLHFYFEHPGVLVRNDAGKRFGPGLDVRGDGGYVIAPPSIHASGRRYLVSADAPVQPLPGWMLERLREPERHRVLPLPDPSSVKAGRWAKAALSGELRAVEQSSEGCRNDVLNRAAFNLGQIVGAGGLSEEDVHATLTAAGMSVGLSERECRSTVSSGLRAGVAAPRTPNFRPSMARNEIARDVPVVDR